jgi:hypothetical protein
MAGAGAGAVGAGAGRVDDGTVVLRCEGRATEDVVTGATVVVTPAAATAGGGGEMNAWVGVLSAWLRPGRVRCVLDPPDNVRPRPTPNATTATAAMAPTAARFRIPKAYVVRSWSRGDQFSVPARLSCVHTLRHSRKTSEMDGAVSHGAERCDPPPVIRSRFAP